MTLSHPPHRTPLRRLVGATLLAGSLTLGASWGGAHDSLAVPDEGPAVPEHRPGTELAHDGEPVTITLITGDTVRYADRGGAVPSITVERHPDSGTQDVVATLESDGVYVLPDVAQPLVDADVLDRRLFNVEYLAENGYTAEEVSALPVIVTYEPETGGPGRRASVLSDRADALPAVAADARELPSINGVAARVELGAVDEFWSHIEGAAQDELLATSSRAAGAPIEKVWLDGKVVPTLDDSRGQIGVPEAWDLGFDGSGVTVAVLDTGYDPDHPDLAGRVVDAVSFVPGQDATDVDGHGTHVASTVAGTGAASDGRYAGVAPGADLVVGKVLTGGFGLDSWVISGMEWAGENADVVNMSLGTLFPNDGSDPVSLALNRISEEQGTLFVVSAGNSGPARSTVTPPATADAALAVAAVDNDDLVAPFSSRGPRVGNLALKPEIAAPGNPVVAARAAEAPAGAGVPVGEHYLAAAGTSMAAPHVTGVAAMLVQRYPDWGPQQLKDALMSTAVGGTGFDLGAGRLDAARVTANTLFATGKADFGLVRPEDGRSSRTITYTNTGDADLTLELSLDVTDADGTPVEGALSLSHDEVRVPAGGAASVQLTLDASAVPHGDITGQVRAEASDGQHTATVVALVSPTPTHRVTVQALGRTGEAPYSGTVVLSNIDDVRRFEASVGLDATGRAVFEVPAGNYSAVGRISTRDQSRPSQMSSTDAFAVEVLGVDGDRTVTVDAGEADDFTFEVVSEQRPLEPTQITTNLYRTDARGQRTGLIALSERQNTDAAFGVVPAPEPTVGDLTMTVLSTFREPILRARVDGDGHDLVTRTPNYTGRFAGEVTAEVVDVGTGSAEEFAGVDVSGRIALVETDDSYVQSPAALATEAGAVAMLAVPAAPGVASVAVASDNELPVLATTYAEGSRLREALADGRLEMSLTGVRESTYTYVLRGREQGEIPVDPTYTFTRSDLAVVDSSFHSEAERRGSENLRAYEDWEGGALTFMHFLQQPTTRTDYVVAGPGILQEQNVSSLWGASSARLDGAPTAYRPGQRVAADWFRAPNHPSAYTPLPCNFCRSEAILRFAPRPYGDADPTHTGSGRVWVTYRTFRDGELIDQPGALLVPEPATYRIEQVTEAVPDEAHWLASRSETAWTFRSEAPSALELDDCRELLPGANACAALPVLLLGYDVPLRLDNSAPAGRAFNFRVRVDHALGDPRPVRLAGATAEVSFDDGRTWETAKVIRSADEEGFRVQTRHPRLARTNGFVSLRVEVWDEAGNRTEQTIERAYALTE